MPIYIISAEDSAATYGAFTTREAAEQRRADIHKNGYFGGLDIVEDTLEGLE